jgi:hypothetical protein
MSGFDEYAEDYDRALSNPMPEAFFLSAWRAQLLRRCAMSCATGMDR